MTPEETLYQFIAAIPAGNVATYGQLARLAGRPSSARWAGRTLKHLPKDSSLPWHRVINAQGKVSKRVEAQRQKALLEEEGVVFVEDKLNLAHYQWSGSNEPESHSQGALF